MSKPKATNPDPHARLLNDAGNMAKRAVRDVLAGRNLQDLVAAYARGTGRDFHFHPRSLWLSQAMEIGKWIVKRIGGRKDAAFPSYRDLKSRELYPELACGTAREMLGWKPCDDGNEIVRRVLGTPDGEGR